MLFLSPYLFVAFVGIAFMIYRQFHSEIVRRQCCKPNDKYSNIPFLFSNRPNSNSKASVRYRQWKWQSENTDKKAPKTWIVFLGDSGDTLDIFDNVIGTCVQSLLTKSYESSLAIGDVHFINYDRIGFGQSSSFNTLCFSPQITPVSAYQRAQSLLLLLESIGMDIRSSQSVNQIILVGHNYGGLIAQSFIKMLNNEYAALLQRRESKLKVSNLLLNGLIPLKKGGIFPMKELNFDLRKIAYCDILRTILGVNSERFHPMMLQFYGLYPELSKYSMHQSAIQNCYYYRNNSTPHRIALWNEFCGLKDTLLELRTDDKIESENLVDWAKQLSAFAKNLNITIRLLHSRNAYVMAQYVRDCAGKVSNVTVSDRQVPPPEFGCNSYLVMQDEAAVVAEINNLIFS